MTAAFARLNEQEQRAVLAYRDEHGTSELRFSIYLQHHDSPPDVPLGRGAAAAKRAATVDHLSLHSDSMRAGTMERDALCGVITGEQAGVLEAAKAYLRSKGKLRVFNYWPADWGAAATKREELGIMLAGNAISTYASQNTRSHINE